MAAQLDLFIEGAVPMKCDCGHISCVCSVKQKHDEKCRFRIAATTPVGIECDHGYDVCPKCDPCTCEDKPKRQ